MRSKADTPNPPSTPNPDDSKGQGVYGYRSRPLQLADPIRRFSLVLLDDYYPANQREEVPATTGH